MKKKLAVAIALVVLVSAPALVAGCTGGTQSTTPSPTSAATSPSSSPVRTPAVASSNVQLQVTRAVNNWVCINQYAPGPLCEDVQSAAVVEGRLTDANGNGIGGRQIILYTYSHVLDQWHSFAQVTTDSTGNFRYAGEISAAIGNPTESDSAGARFAGDSTYATVDSSPVQWAATISYIRR